MRRELFTAKNTLYILWLVVKNFKSLLVPLLSIRNWPLYYLDYFRFLKGGSEVIYRLRNNIKLIAVANQGDGVIINEIWGEKIYTPFGYKINNGDVVVDIGAHKGYFSIYAACKAHKGKVYAFEPFKENFDILKKNIYLNSITNTFSQNLGISGKRGTRKLFVNPFSMAGVSFIPEWFSSMQDEAQRVKAFRQKFITLSDILKIYKIDRINFLKSDCEGAEYDIFLKAPSSVLRRIDILSMEYHQINEFKVKDLVRLFEHSGFTVVISDPYSTIGMLYAKNKSIFQ